MEHLNLIIYKGKINGKKYLKKIGIFLIFVLISGLIGGYCAGLYLYDTLSPNLLQQLQEQNVRPYCNCSICHIIWDYSWFYWSYYFKESKFMEEI